MVNANSCKKYFIADLHFGHKNILTLCNRRFTDIDEHDKYLISCINEKVGKDEHLYILGDIGFHKDIDRLREVLQQIVARKHIILGNHDSLHDLTQLKKEHVIEDVKEFQTVQKNNKCIVCCHYPLKEWRGYYRGYYHAYGHVHGTIPQYDRCLDVGVDNIGYYPLEFDEVIEKIEAGMKPEFSRVTKEDEMINEYFPNLSVHYFVGLCTGNEEIREVIKKVLTENKKG